MKRGAKRPPLSDPDSDPNLPADSILRSKRVTEAPTFDVHRAESSRQHHPMEGIPLDAKHTELARQHVRALNTQFASWVQLQLQNHPDELWEDGVKDYLSHASHILDQFKDVVDWLRADAAKSETATTASLPSDHNKSVAVLGNSKRCLKSEVNNGSAQEITSSNLQSSALSNSQGSGLFSVSQTSSSSSSLQNSVLPFSQNSGLFTFSQKPASSSLQSSSFSSSQSMSVFGISQKPATSSLQSSGLPSSQTSGFFGFNQTPTSSSLQSSGLSSSHSSDLQSKKPATSTLQSSGLPSSQASGFFGFNQTPTSSSLESSGLSSSHSSDLQSKKPATSTLQSSGLPSSQTSGFFGFNQTPTSSSLESSSISSSQSSGLQSQKPATSSLQSSGLPSSQVSGFFGFNQTPTSSSLQSSGLSSSQSSSLFGINQTPARSSLQSSALSSAQSSGFFGISQKPTNSNLQNSWLSSAQNSGFSSINQVPVFGGNQSFGAPKVEAAGDVDEENELEQPSSPSLKKTEEKGVIVVHEVKCKVYVKPDNPADKAWKDMGVGQLSIKCKEGANKAAKESNPTIIIRNDVGKLLLNALIYPGIKMNIKKNTIAIIFHTSVGGQNDGVEDGKGNVVARTYLLRLKTEDENTKLAAAIQDYAPSS